MRMRLIGSILLAFALLAVSPAMQAQTSAKPGPAAATAIPDLSGNWAPHRPVPVTGETALCGIRRICDELRGVEAPTAEKLEEPEMQPWAEEKYRAVREGKSRDPNFTGCTPQSPTDLMLDNRRLYELRQFPDVVLLLFDEDHLVRRIYMDGRAHPDGSLTTWMGHSIGKYEGDTLVVDTVGFNDKNWIDRLGPSAQRCAPPCGALPAPGPENLAVRSHDRRSESLQKALDQEDGSGLASAGV